MTRRPTLRFRWAWPTMLGLLVVAVVNVAVFPASTRACRAILPGLNPFALVFADTLDIHNDTGMPVEVTPLGVFQGDSSETRVLLPTLCWEAPAVRGGRRKQLKVGAGETIQVTYDVDDVVFAELVIGSGDGAARLLRLVRNASTLDPSRDRPRSVDITSDLPLLPIDDRVRSLLGSDDPRESRCFLEIVAPISIHVLSLLALVIFTIGWIITRARGHPAV